MDNNSEPLASKWKRDRADEDEERKNDRSRTSPEIKRRKPDNINLANGEERKPLGPSEHTRYMSILSRLFPEQKRNVLDLILKGCGGDIAQTIETVLPSHEEAIARGQIMAAAAAPRGIFPSSPLPNGFPAFTPLSPTIPPGLPMSPAEYQAAVSCASGQCPGCVYYPGVGQLPVGMNHMKDGKRECLEAASLGKPSMLERSSPPVPRMPVPHPEDMRAYSSQGIRSATAALITMSSMGRVFPGTMSSIKSDRSPSPRCSPKHDASNPHMDESRTKKEWGELVYGC